MGGALLPLVQIRRVPSVCTVGAAFIVVVGALGHNILYFQTQRWKAAPGETAEEKLRRCRRSRRRGSRAGGSGVERQQLVEDDAVVEPSQCLRAQFQ